MVSCRKAKELLADLTENALPVEQREAVLAHLRGCGHCVTFLETYRKTSSLCRASLSLKVAPPELVERLMSYLRDHANAG